MELLLLAAAVGGVIWAIRAAAGGFGRPPIPSPQTDIQSERRRTEYQRRARMRQEAARRTAQAYRELQQTLLQLRNAPDFRRAAAAAQRARQVPLPYRQQQFRRFRPLLVAFLADKLRRGANARQAAAGLQELVTALGLASFEAEYIVNDAQRRTATAPAQPPSFAEQARQWQQEHHDRLQTIRALPDLDPEVREQLLELEQERFREQLLRGGGSDGSTDQRQSLQG